MTRNQFLLLNIISFMLVIVLIAQFFLSRDNAISTGALNNQQAVISNARQLETVLDQLAKRIARDSETNAALRDLLVKYDMRVTLEVDGKQKNYP